MAGMIRSPFLFLGLLMTTLAFYRLSHDCTSFTTIPDSHDCTSFTRLYPIPTTARALHDCTNFTRLHPIPHNDTCVSPCLLATKQAQLTVYPIPSLNFEQLSTLSSLTHARRHNHRKHHSRRTLIKIQKKKKKTPFPKCIS
ncbi:uncharacterized protein K452DRAFT_51103 [Aplosporella prunicola CBS 121167]|uniref:Uncharacterized protein n=1 Tax=Aplosporella prunicola CBS 121167 TaxID=1176127 RepID=A0A6A6BCZ7_9PEZI|nr:uncharacterized protein K452DRAFT_51103 [Aplosporella prunicola CBS 121167]KAF2140777.1 hypothetical protein K452DRAFT_51103 [Aplosporella prunicola CBS 121167]